MKNIIPTLTILVLSSLFLFSCNLTKPSPNLDLSLDSDSITPMDTTSPSVNPTDLSSPDQIGQIRVQLQTKYGPIVMELFKSQAPNTVDNFLAKVQSKFYNGLTFHRVEPGFVVQGGDPLGNGTGGGNIASEINNLPFKRASLGLARGGDINISNDSQFFICLTDEQCSHLTNQYVNFGSVVSGMEFVDQIKPADQIISIDVLTK